MQLITLVVLGVAVVALATIHFIKTFREINSSKFPPGPTQFPVVGRIHDLPIQYMWVHFKNWGDKYGGGRGFYRTSMLGLNFLIVTDEKVADDLLIRRAKINSDRPQIRSLFDSKSTDGGGAYLPLMGRNAYWARQRKMVHAFLTEAANARYWNIMSFEAKRWLARLATDPENFQASLEDMTAKVMCTLAWDDTTYSKGLSEVAYGLLTQMSPAGCLSNVLTPLWHLPLPLNKWKRHEVKRHADQHGYWMDRMLEVRERMARGEQRPCWTRQFLEREAAMAGASGITGDHEASGMLGMLATVGVFTVGSPLSFWLIVMATYPKWQAACQKEVDEACGGRMPELSDMPNLPVLRACIKETLRWRPAVPTGVAHETEADQLYNGYVIPKGTCILPLDWAMMRNPVKYPEPDSFRPERWLEPEWPTFQGPLTTYPTIKGMTSFGWGQRQCLGMSLMQDELVVACGALAYGFNITPPRDPATGLEVPVPSDQTTSLLIVKPKPFKVVFKPRSEKRRMQMLEDWEEAEKNNVAEKEAFLEKARQSRAVVVLRPQDDVSHDAEKQAKDTVLIEISAVEV